MRFLATLLRDLTGLSGIGLISYGSWCIYQPAGMIVGGTLLLSMAVSMARGSNQG